MYPRVEYKLTEQELNIILEASKPTRVMQIGKYSPRTPQQNANDAWEALGKKRGFDYMTVQPVPNKNKYFFSAVPTEPEDVRLARLEEEKKAEKIKKKNEIRAKIEKLNYELIALDK